MVMTFNQIKQNDFILVLKPVMRNRKEDDKIIAEWTGEIQVKILADLAKSSLKEYEIDSMSRICTLMAASIPTMHENAFVRYIIDKYAEHSFIDLEHIDLPEHKEEKTEGNVITLKFDSETEGNA